LPIAIYVCSGGQSGRKRQKSRHGRCHVCFLADCVCYCPESGHDRGCPLMSANSQKPPSRDYARANCCGAKYRRTGRVTDRLRSYRAALKIIGNSAGQECGRWLNNRSENSHQPFRRREGAMARFRDIKTLQKFAAVHASIHNHFNQDRHLNRRNIFKQNRAAALAEWRQLGV